MLQVARLLGPEAALPPEGGLFGTTVKPGVF